MLESVCYFFSQQTDDFLRNNKQTILDNYKILLKDAEYIDSIRFATGDKKRVKMRFNRASEILGKV